ncbi:MAG: methyltransferase domain-containing protein [Victivallaceae bacterium]|nr:methyltransferase domain-containing protein [Victivallaceae bacterium]
MNYPKSQKYNTPELNAKIMGPNPVKLAEELLQNHRIPVGATVLDLGSGLGLTSVFLVKEYHFRVYAGDLWSDPEENQAFFSRMGLRKAQITAVKADAENPPFEPDFFDAVVSIDSYNYFGRKESYLDDKLLPCVKSGGLLYLSFPGMKKDLHDHLPEELLLSWTPEQLDYLHDLTFWEKMFAASKDAEILSLAEMESNDEVWRDWIACDNAYAVNDRKSIHAGGGQFLNFIAAILRKK